MKRKTKNNSESLLILKDKDINNETIPIEKVHIYNNNRHLQKSNSTGAIRLFFEPYYSELKNSTNNNLFNSKPLKKSILQIEYVNFPKIDDALYETIRPERYLQKKNVFANNNGYNNYNINNYNNSFGRNDYYRYNNVNINRLPKISNNYNYNYDNNYNNFGYNNKYNQGYDYNDNQYDDNNYYRRRELGELYSRVFLSRDNINDMNSKIRNYYIKNIDRPSNNDRYFNYNRMRNNPRNYTFKNMKRDDIIINDIKASRKYREFVFFQNLKKYIEPQQSIIDEDKKSKLSKESDESRLSNVGKIGILRKSSKKSKESEKEKMIEQTEKKSTKKEMVKEMIDALRKTEKKDEDKKSDKESSDDEEEEEESDSEDKNKKEKKKEETKEKQENKNT